ncbi:MAG TPA: nicotinate phosphoribosyltransferase [Egibacteraceae bacterium]|jgi:nicotinate phosphoribosyltransferase|nr:nicotinate phosphoribosyltransferase [Egibacteraceae bacterium]
MERSDALFTDLYELTMMAGYHAEGRADQPATFDLFFRKPPAGVDVVVAAGLDPVLDYLENLRFTDDDLRYLDGLGLFRGAFLDLLAALRFTGDVWAVPEGLPVFGEEPILRVTAPLVQAQLVETALLNRICYASLVASNAAQIVTAARGKAVLEFGARRAHGPDGAITGGRAALIGGCAATSNVAVGQRFAAPLSGTMAHSWVMSYDRELDAFRAYARAFPDTCVLLVDTYDTLAVGLPNAITVAGELAERGHELSGVRLDSGDLGLLAREARRMLDDAGFPKVRVLASGDLDAPRIAALEEEGAPIDGYGVGTSLLTARHDPAFGGVYKLADVDGEPVLKVSGSPEKTTSPGCKQVWRQPHGDVIGLADDDLDGQPLLVPAMRDGRREVGPVPIDALRERCRAAVADIRPLVLAGAWTVRRSARLEDLRARMIARLRADAC